MQSTVLGKFDTSDISEAIWHVRFGGILPFLIVRSFLNLDAAKIAFHSSEKLIASGPTLLQGPVCPADSRQCSNKIRILGNHS